MAASGSDPWSAGAAVLGSGLDFVSQERANRQNKDIWRKTQDWQEMMSNTQYQRAVADMKAAGLNPMLLASKGFSGAGVPGTGTGAPMQSATSGKAASNAMQSLLLQAQQNLMSEQAKTERTRQDANSAQAAKTRIDAKNAATQQPGLQAQAWWDSQAISNISRIVANSAKAVMGLAGGQAFKFIPKERVNFRTGEVSNYW